MRNLPQAMNNPFSVTVCEGSLKTALIFLLAYGMGIGIYLSTRRNYRRREEHGSAKWGDAGAINKKYRDKDPTENKLLTQNVRIGLDGKKHRRNLNILVCGGSGAGKTTVTPIRSVHRTSHQRTYSAVSSLPTLWRALR